MSRMRSFRDEKFLARSGVTLSEHKIDTGSEVNFQQIEESWTRISCSRRKLP